MRSVRVRNRRGTSIESAIVTLVVFGAVFIIIALLYKSMLETGKKEFSDKECQASLLVTRIVDKPLSLACVKVADNPIPLKCQRHFLSVDATIVKDTGGTKSDDITFKYDATCKESTASCLAANVLASEMRRCWTLFSEGQMPVFQQVDKTWEIGNNNRACFVCAEVTVAGAPITGFTQYLKDTPVPKSGRVTSDIKYFDFLAGNPKALCGPTRDKLEGSCWESFKESFDPAWYNTFLRLGAIPAVDQETLAPGTYAVVFMREGMESAACEKEGESDYTPTLTVQAIPAARIAEYCPVVLT